MAYSTANISNIRQAIHQNELFVWWTSSAPVGTVMQVYVNRVLAWWGTETQVTLPYPSHLTRIDVGTVAANEGPISFLTSLPSANPDRAYLTWIGGSFEGDDLAGFHVYMSLTAGGPINYTAFVADIPAYFQGIALDGFGVGGFGEGGFGAASMQYSWRSDPLAGGIWNFAVIPYDTAGNEGVVRTCSMTIIAPPLPPAADLEGRRIYLVYDPATHKATVTWNSSPG